MVEAATQVRSFMRWRVVALAVLLSFIGCVVIVSTVTTLWWWLQQSPTLARRPNSNSLAYERGNYFKTTPPSFSPDGKRVAYASTSTGCGDIYLRSGLGFGAVSRLTATEQLSESSPHFVTNNLLVFQQERGFEQWIVAQDIGTATLHTVSHVGGQRESIRSVSGDGNYVVVGREYFGQASDELVLIETSDMTETTIGRGWDPVIVGGSVFYNSSPKCEIQEYVIHSGRRLTHPVIGNVVGSERDGVFFVPPSESYSVDHRICSFDGVSVRGPLLLNAHGAVSIGDAGVLAVTGYSESVVEWRNGRVLPIDVAGIKDPISLFRDPQRQAIWAYSRGRSTKGSLWKYMPTNRAFERVFDVE